MSRTTRRMTDSQIEEARSLRASGWTKKMLAAHYGLGPTVIWENVYRTKPRKRLPTFRTVTAVRVAVSMLKDSGMNSRQAASALEVPPEDVNWIWTRLTILK